MKKIIYLVLLFLANLTCAMAQKGVATLRISLKNMKQSKVSLAPDGQLKFVTSYGQILLDPDENGIANLSIPLDKAGYFLLSRNPLYLAPGDKLDIDLRDDNLETVIQRKGNGYQANEYLKNRYYAKGGSFLDMGKVMREGTDNMAGLLDSLVTKREKDLEALSGVSKRFKELESVRIKADFVNSLFYYPTYSKTFYPKGLSKLEYKAIINNYYLKLHDRIQPILDELASDDDYLDIEVVRNVLYRFRENKAFQVNVSKRFGTLLEVGAEADKIRGNIKLADYKSLLAYGEQISYNDIQQLFFKKLSLNSKLMEGKPAADVKLVDANGKETTLSALGKDKVIYVDVWATWCGPCKLEAPYYLELSKKYPNILFLSISIDDNRKAWKDYVTKKNEESVVHALATDNIRTNWDIGGIPRFMLIDKSFNIISADALRPTSKKISAYLDQL